jgi:hypothetical protein
MLFEKVKGRKSKSLQEDLVGKTLVLEFKNGSIYGGILDGYEEGIVYMIGCKRLDKKRKEWKNHGIMVEYKGKEMEDIMPRFYLSEIQNIYALPEDFDEEGIDMIDLLQLFLDPNFKIIKGIKCEGGMGKQHSVDCDKHLHDALVLLATQSYSNAEDPKERDRLLEARQTIRKSLIGYGAKIP